MLTKAAAINVIGDSVEDVDEENGNENVKITLVQRTETKTYVVQQGRNHRKGQEILTVFTRAELKQPDRRNQVFSDPEAGEGCSRH